MRIFVSTFEEVACKHCYSKLVRTDMHPCLSFVLISIFLLYIVPFVFVNLVFSFLWHACYRLKLPHACPACIVGHLLHNHITCIVCWILSLHCSNTEMMGSPDRHVQTLRWITALNRETCPVFDTFFDGTSPLPTHPQKGPSSQGYKFPNVKLM